MSSIGRFNTGATGNLDLTVDLNQSTISSIQQQNGKIQQIEEELEELETEIKQDLIGNLGTTTTTNEDGSETTTNHSVRENLETLYEILTGVALATEPEVGGAMIAGKELYDQTNHLYETGHSVFEGINTIKNDFFSFVTNNDKCDFF